MRICIGVVGGSLVLWRVTECNVSRSWQEKLRETEERKKQELEQLKVRS